jgi:hypothetical protein
MRTRRREFVKMLGNGPRRRGLEVWSDERILANEQRSAKPEDAIARTRAALLLVTSDLPGSRSRMDRDLPALCARTVGLVPVLVRPRVSEEPVLASVQWEHDQQHGSGLA